MTRFPYNCVSAKRALGTLLSLLRRERVLAEDIYQPQLDAFVTVCAQCGNRRRARHCSGWCYSIGAEHALVFEPAEHKERLVRPSLHGTCDFRRPNAGAREDWERAPLTQSTVVVLLFEGVAIEQPCERHHLDLANELQPGPVWHLQLGGNPSGYDKFATSWLGPPRWAVPPADIVLVAETLVFNFYPRAFEKLNRDGDWVRLVQSAEDLVLTHYRQRMEQHFLRGSARDSTWLAAQDNEAMLLNPRPA